MRRLAITGVAIALLALAVYVFARAYATYGERLVNAAQSRAPEYAVRQGQQFERAGRLPDAIAAYRHALALGIDWPPTREDTMRRLTALLGEQGRVPEYRERFASSLIAGGSLDDPTVDAAPWGIDATAYPDCIDPVEKVQGIGALRIDLAKQPTLSLTQAFTVVPNTEYECSLWVRTEKVDAAYTLTALGIGDNKEAPLATSDTFTSTKEWHQNTFAVSVPEGTEHVVLKFASMSTAARGTVWIDHVTYRPQKESMLTNGSFEFGEDGRTQWHGDLPADCSVSIDTAVVREGRQSLRVDLKASTNFGLWQPVDVSPGAKYRLTAWIRTENADSAGACLAVHDADHGWQAFEVTTLPKRYNTTDWTQVELEFTAPDNMRAASILLRKPNAPDAGNASGTIWFDACHLERVGETPQ